MAEHDGQFAAGLPVIGTDLVGREREITEVVAQLTTGQSVILMGPRRYGKTSLALEVLNHLPQNTYHMDMDLFGIANVQELAQKLVASCLALKSSAMQQIFKAIKEGLTGAFKNLELKQTVHDYEIVLKLAESKPTEPGQLEDAFAFLEIFAVKQKRPLVVYLDEFGEIERLGGIPLLKKLRAIMQRQRHVTYLFSGSQVHLMQLLFSDRQGPFFKFANVLPLQTPEHKAMVRYLDRQFKKLRIATGPGFSEAILQLVHDHPYYMQRVGQQVSLANLTEKKKRWVSSNLQTIKDRLIRDEGEHYAELTQRLSSSKHALSVMRALVLHGDPYRETGLDKQTSYQVIKVLIEQGFVIRQEKGTYGVIDPMYIHYLKGLWD